MGMGWKYFSLKKHVWLGHPNIQAGLYLDFSLPITGLVGLVGRPRPRPRPAPPAAQDNWKRRLVRCHDHSAWVQLVFNGHLFLPQGWASPHLVPMSYLHPQSLGCYRRYRHRCVRNLLTQLHTCNVNVVLLNLTKPTCLVPAPAALSCLSLCPGQSCCSLLVWFNRGPPSLQHFKSKWA